MNLLIDTSYFYKPTFINEDSFAFKSNIKVKLRLYEYKISQKKMNEKFPKVMVASATYKLV